MDPGCLLRTRMSTTPFIHQLTAYLNDVFAPRITLHGSLVDVYGVGLLFAGSDQTTVINRIEHVFAALEIGL